MNGVPRLQHLPVPATSAGAPAVAQPQGSAGRQVEPVEPVTPAVHVQTGRSQGRAQVEDAPQRREGKDRPARLAAEEGAANRPFTPSRLTSMPFMVQLLGQQAGAGRPQAAAPQTTLSGHRDAAVLGSDIYRRAGGEPELLPEGATFVRFAV